MLHSFVVGVTPEGRRHSLFVGTIGEARSFMDAAEKAVGVVEKVAYQALHLVEGAAPTFVTAFPAPPVSPPPASATTQHDPPAPKPQTSAAAAKVKPAAVPKAPAAKKPDDKLPAEAEGSAAAPAEEDTGI